MTLEEALHYQHTSLSLPDWPADEALLLEIIDTADGPRFKRWGKFVQGDHVQLMLLEYADGNVAQWQSTKRPPIPDDLNVHFPGMTYRWRNRDAVKYPDRFARGVLVL